MRIPKEKEKNVKGIYYELTLYFDAWNKEELIIDFNLKICDDVPKLIEEYIYYYNNERPSYALKYKTPIQYKIESGF